MLLKKNKLLEDMEITNEESNTEKQIRLISFFFEFLVNVDRYSVSLSDRNFIHLEMSILYFLNSIMIHALSSLEVVFINFLLLIYLLILYNI